MFHALKTVIGETVHFIWHQNTSLASFEAVVLPGGFSYGDYLRAGAIARFSPIMKEVIQFARKGKPVLGICNGFQILTESGLLPGALRRNENLRFACKHVYIRTENCQTIFTKRLQKAQVLSIPIAHGDGNYFIDKFGLKKLEDNQQILFRYCSSTGLLANEFNPNVS
jgi:phosphoribosylformylglycinamidine synthase